MVDVSHSLQSAPFMSAPEWTEEPAPEVWGVPKLQMSSHGWTCTGLRSNDPLPPTDDLYRWILNGPAAPDEEEPRKRKPQRLAPLRISSSEPNLQMQLQPEAAQQPLKWKGALARLRPAIAIKPKGRDTDWLATMEAHGREMALREHVQQQLRLPRPPTPQYAARRALPPRTPHLVPSVPREAPASHGWQPSGAQERCAADQDRTASRSRITCD